jgi:hypothetical protein
MRRFAQVGGEGFRIGEAEGVAARKAAIFSLRTLSTAFDEVDNLLASRFPFMER